jgi:7-cyano-7-deazaguanine synthase
MTTHNRAVVLLSGGLDSATAAAMSKARGFELYALSFRYGQRHAVELEAARRVAAALGVAGHAVVDIDLRAFGGSALNTIFLAFALAWAETLGITDIVIGVNALDYSGYPDCRPEFIAAFQHLANLATRAGTELKQRFTIHTPLILFSKREIVQRGAALGLDYGLTLSCYDPSDAGEACGHCDACQLRLKGFREAGLDDPGRYQTAKSGAG